MTADGHDLPYQSARFPVEVNLDVQFGRDRFKFRIEDPHWRVVYGTVVSYDPVSRSAQMRIENDPQGRIFPVLTSSLTLANRERTEARVITSAE